ncbi:hypothetical protein EDD86DRAFT_186564 [Gorgonomyces haynaldii]|nr:hypothetical protein EDD86DRAFT_186564 [Gorgonomyces haynaldii]
MVSLFTKGFDGRVKLKKHDEQQRNATWMDQERTKLQAYEYLCHIGEAKEWMEACLKSEIGAIDRLDEELRNGIVLANLAKFFHAPSVKKIFEDTSKLQFRHSDNINYFFQACKAVELPEIFLFELTDLYEKKNIPKVIYCIHALSHFLAKKGLAPRIKDLLGKLDFSEDVLNATADGIKDVNMPAFGNIQNALAAELNEETEEEKRFKYFKENEQKIIKVQAQVKMHLTRRAYKDAIEHYKNNVDKIIKIQALIKARKQHKEYLERKNLFKSNEELFTKIQALYRGKKQREAFVNRQKVWNDNINAIIKLQAWWKGRQAAIKYKALRMAAGHTDTKTLQQYINLLDDSVNDFEEEDNLDKLRKEVVKKIRENLQAETLVTGLDSKIALLVKNRISIEEVVHFNSKQMRSHLAQELAAALEKNGGIITLKGSDKEATKKRKSYEELFYLLQTQPRYLSSLMFNMNKLGGNVSKFLEGVVLTLYGYAQNPREEYLFLSLIESCIAIEIQEITKLEDFWRDNPLFIKLVLQFTRGAKERAYLRDLLQPLIKAVLGDNELELETEPVAIYKQLIRNEELKTGEKSAKPYDVTPQDASQDEDVKKIQTERTKRLTAITQNFFKAIVGSIKSMPFGIRYIAMNMKDRMRKRFHGQENESEINRFVGNLIYYRYINPAIVAPEAFDVIDTVISPIQRKNLAEIAKTLHQVQVNRPVSGTTESSQIMNEFIASTAPKFSVFVKEAANVPSLQEYFEMNEFADMSRQEKPSIYITPQEVLQVHANLSENLSILSTDAQDPLNIILSELGPVPPVDSGAKGPGSEVTLHLSNRFAKTEDPKDVERRHLETEAKRLISCVIRFTAGKSLLKLLEEQSTEAQQAKYVEYVRIINTKQESYIPAEGEVKVDVLAYLKNQDGSFMTFGQVKQAALEKMAHLESLGLVSQKDEYQTMLDSIAEDMLTKQRRRAQRKREFQVLKNTMKNLQDKAQYLDEQKQSYNNYIEACMGQLQNKHKGKSKKPMLFSKQYYHVRDLQKSGQMPKFGSFKYTAQELHKKGVLISIDDYSPKQYGGITLTISSNEAGVFSIDASFLGVAVADKMELRLEELLQYQYDKVDVITLFDLAKVNVNLLVFLINKKYCISS